MSELLEYHSQLNPLPVNSSVLATENYLRALNNIFERTLLGNKTRIFASEGTAMKRLDEGFSYFVKWAQEIYDKKGFVNSVDNKQFISWQVNI